MPVEMVRSAFGSPAASRSLSLYLVQLLKFMNHRRDDLDRSIERRASVAALRRAKSRRTGPHGNLRNTGVILSPIRFGINIGRTLHLRPPVISARCGALLQCSEIKAPTVRARNEGGVSIRIPLIL